MKELVITKIGKEITGIFLHPETIDETLAIEIIDFNNVLAPWQEKVLERIDEPTTKLIKIA